MNGFRETTADSTRTVVLAVDQSVAAQFGATREAKRAAVGSWVRCFPVSRYDVRLVFFSGPRETLVDARVDQFTGAGRIADLSAALEKITLAEASAGTVRPMVVVVTSGRAYREGKDAEETELSPKATSKPRPMNPQAEEDARGKALRLCASLNGELYVVNVGDNPDRMFLRSLTEAANGRVAASNLFEIPAEQLSLHSPWFRQHLCDAGLVGAEQRAKFVEKYLTRIASPPNPTIDYCLGAGLFFVVFGSLSAAVRRFPAPGDSEWIELREGDPVFLATGITNPVVLVHHWAAEKHQGLQVTRGPEWATVGLLYRIRFVHILGYRQCADFERLDSFTKQFVLFESKRVAESLERLIHGLPSDPDTEKARRLREDMRKPDYDRVQATLDQLQNNQTVPGIDLTYAKVCLAYHPTLAAGLGPERVLSRVDPETGEETAIDTAEAFSVGPHRFRFRSLDENPESSPSSIQFELVYERPEHGLGLKRLLPVGIQKALRLRRSKKHVLWVRSLLEAAEQGSGFGVQGSRDSK